MSSTRFVTLLSERKHLSFQVAVFNRRDTLSAAHKHIDGHFTLIVVITSLSSIISTRLSSVLELRQLLFIVTLEQLQEWVLVYAVVLLLEEKLDLILTSFVGEQHTL